jgi:hypothetical protein
MATKCVYAAIDELRQQISAKQQHAAEISRQLHSQQQQSDWRSAQQTSKHLQSIHEALQGVEQQFDATNGVNQPLYPF